MAKIRKTHPLQTKVKVALEAIKGEKTTSEITSKYGIHTTQVNTWKKQVLEQIPNAFSRKKKKQKEDQQKLVDELYRQCQHQSKTEPLHRLKSEPLILF